MNAFENRQKRGKGLVSEDIFQTLTHLDVLIVNPHLGGIGQVQVDIMCKVTVSSLMYGLPGILLKPTNNGA